VAAHARIASSMRIEFSSDAMGEERVLLDGREVSSLLRTEVAGAGASRVAAWTAVRDALLERQRAFCRTPGLIADGQRHGPPWFFRTPCSKSSSPRLPRKGPPTL